MSDANSSGDSSELEALFDSIAGGVVGSASTQAPAPAPAAATKPSLMQQVRETIVAAGDATYGWRTSPILQNRRRARC